MEIEQKSAILTMSVADTVDEKKGDHRDQRQHHDDKPEVQEVQPDPAAISVSDEAEKSTASPCSVPEPSSFRTPPPLLQHSQQQPLQQQPQQKQEQERSVEVERSCMETRGRVNVKWDITRKNKNSIVIDGYKMTESRSGKDGRVFWRCSKRFCSATAISLGTRLLSVRQVDSRRFHNHPPTGKEEFFRGDFGSPGTPTQVTIKWPVTRLMPSSVTASQSSHHDSVTDDQHSLLMPKTSVVEDYEDEDGEVFEDEHQHDPDAMADDAADGSSENDDQHHHLDVEDTGTPAPKRMRRASLEDLASIQRRLLADPLTTACGAPGIPAGGGFENGSGVVGSSSSGNGVGSSTSGAGGLQALATAAGLHGNFSAAAAAAAAAAIQQAQQQLAVKSAAASQQQQQQQQQQQLQAMLQQQHHQLPSPHQQLQQRQQLQQQAMLNSLHQHHQQQQQQQQLHQQTPESVLFNSLEAQQKALLSLALNSGLMGNTSLQPAAPYNPIFNPPPPPPPTQQQSQLPAHHHQPQQHLQSPQFRAPSNNLHQLQQQHHHQHLSDSLEGSSPLKEALSQVDNSQLRRQLRRLEGYFRSGIVSVSEAVMRQQLSAKDPASERESLVKLFSYMEGLERVHKLSAELP